MVALLLGLNKQLDMQSLLQMVGRDIVEAFGFYGERRVVQKLFLGLFSITGVALVGRFLAKNRGFFKQNVLALLGLLLLLAFVLLRAASAEHLERLLGLDISRPKWRWGLELGGLGFLAFEAVRASYRIRPRESKEGAGTGLSLGG